MRTGLAPLGTVRMRAYAAIVWIMGAWICLIQVSPGVGSLPLESSTRGPESARQVLREKAIRMLDDLVQRERFYHRRTGTYTSILGRLEFEIPEDLRSQIQVQVLEAVRDRLLVQVVTAVEKLPGEVAPRSDQIWMNQFYQLQANFELPGRQIASTFRDSEEPLSELVIEPVQESASLERRNSESSQ